MGGKRTHLEAMGRSDEAAGQDSSDAFPTSRFMPEFERFRTELDEHHDRRERIIKASRDITAASKKIIFALQRIRLLNAPLPALVVKSNHQYHDTIATQFSAVSRDLQGLNAYRYARQISGGCQEWMEAASFEHYLTTATLLSYPAAVERLKSLDVHGPGVALSFEDYVLGIYDMTGELMRFAITVMATNGALPTIETPVGGEAMDISDHSPSRQRTVLTDMRALRTALEALDAQPGSPFAKDADKKKDVMRQSVEKVERALYGLTVRGAERPKGWMPDTDGRAVEVES